MNSGCLGNGLDMRGWIARRVRARHSRTLFSRRLSLSLKLRAWSFVYSGLIVVRANFPEIAVWGKLSSPMSFSKGSRAMAPRARLSSTADARFSAFSLGKEIRS